MPSKMENKKKQKRPLQHVAPLYSEDIGSDGIKRPRTAPSTGHHRQTFHLQVDGDEEYRRKQREERLGIPCDQGSEVQQPELQVPSPVRKNRGKKKKDRDLQVAKGNHARLVGTSNALEKPYVRLTNFPKADDVRPLPILRKALAHIKNQYIQVEDFDWANEQLKSVRQDITVQHLRNSFVLEVYETHARLLLEYGDLNEFNQCQSMIRTLTSPYQSSLAELDDNEATLYELDGLSLSSANNGTAHHVQQSDEAADEFQAYGLLYSLVQNSWCDLILILSKHSGIANSSDGVTDLVHAKRQSHPKQGGIPAVVRGSSFRHALTVVKAVIHNDYQTFFRLYESAPHLSAYLMDFLLRRVRKGAFDRIIAAYRPTVSVEYIREVLVFQDLEETRQFLKNNGALFVSELGGSPFWVDCKATFASFTNNEC